MLKVILPLSVFLQALLAASPQNDKFFDIFNLFPNDRKIEEPRKVNGYRKEILDSKNDFITKFNGKTITDKALEAQKILMAEYIRLELATITPRSIIEELISDVATDKLREYIRDNGKWYNEIGALGNHLMDMKDSLPFWLSQDYNHLLGLLEKVVDKTKKQLIIDGIEDVFFRGDTYGWDDSHCDGLPNKQDIIDFKNTIQKKKRNVLLDNNDKLRKECASVLQPLKGEIGADLHKSDFEAISEIYFSYLFYNYLLTQTEGDTDEFIYDLIFMPPGKQILDASGTKFLRESLSFKDEIETLRKKLTRPSKYKIDTGSYDESLLFNQTLIDKGTVFVKNAIDAYRASLLKPPPDPNPKPSGTSSSPTPPGKGKLIAIISSVVVFVLAAVVAGLFFYRKSSNVSLN